MAHTVIWMATVYFTAFVGCAFSSPRYTANASAEIDQVDVEIEGNNQTPTTEKVDATVQSTSLDSSTSAENLAHDPGGIEVRETTETSNISNLPDNTGYDNTTNHVKDDHESNNCPNCKPWKEFKEELENRHIASLKEYLLAKLRLDSPPVLKAPVPALPLHELQKKYLQNDAPRLRNKHRPHPNFFAKTVQIFVMGQDETHRCIHKKSTGCYYFDVNGKVSPYDVATAELWIYKLFNHNDPYIQTFFFHELERNNRNNRRRPRNMRRIQTKMKFGWLKIDVKKTVTRWLHKPYTNEGVSIVCKGCQRKDYKKIFSTKIDSMPFIVIQTKKGRRKRQRRSVPQECTPSMRECCLAPLEVNFNSIGWSAVVAPATLRVNYCTGSCNAPYMSHGNHSQVIQDYRWTQASPHRKREMTPCCTPISYAPKSLIYVDASGAYRNVVVPNLQATACGCL